jgi:hypothetical protein
MQTLSQRHNLNLDDMKSIFISLLLWLSVCAFSQNIENVADTCLKMKLLPCKEANTHVMHIDTIESSKFSILIDKLYSKMHSYQELTIEEDKILVLIMNTINWSELDNQSSILVNYSKLSSIEDYFDKMYKKILHCKYGVCIGAGFSSYFIELKVQYMGNPFACSRFFVKL